MKCVMVMFDSLNRHMLPAYGCDWTHAPNFKRLAERSCTFDNAYVCSMPCMPARRDLHTGRPNFLHRSWGPLEPYDDSVPLMLREAGTSSHLISDHYHYWEAGGATYHTQYSTWQFHRGQEGDPWIGQVADPPAEGFGRNASADVWHRQDRVNRGFMTEERDQPQAKTFTAGAEFIRRNHDQDNWFLQIETFDPHEPFFTQRKYRDLYAEHYQAYDGPEWDWPPYSKVTEAREMVEHMRYQYASLLSMCDAKLGDILDLFDEHGLWEDTMLIVWTDHGFMLGEHDSWAKCWMPFYQEIAHTPFFMWDPRSGAAGQRRSALVQPSIDLGPTLLDFFGLETTPRMTGKSLTPVVEQDARVRDAAIFGMFGHQVNVTDGRYVYMRSPTSEDNRPLFNHTLMPTGMRTHFNLDAFTPEKCSLAGPFAWSRDAQVLRIDAGGRAPVGRNPDGLPHTLFDLQEDPGEANPLEHAEVERKMIAHMLREMRGVDAPKDQYERLGIG